VHLSPGELDFCGRILARGQFAYAILDLLISPEGEPYLSEISLKGGLTGSRLGQAGFREQVQRLEEEFCRAWADSSTSPR
jgi:ribosomal protein S6--L-glutamate ligase